MWTRDSLENCGEIQTVQSFNEGAGPPVELNPIGNRLPYQSKPLVLPAEMFHERFRVMSAGQTFVSDPLPYDSHAGARQLMLDFVLALAGAGAVTALNLRARALPRTRLFS